MSSIYQTVAYNNTQKANALLHANGIPVYKNNPNKTALGLAVLVSKYGKAGMTEVAKLHPDAGFIASSFSACDGCNGNCNKNAAANDDVSITNNPTPKPSDVKAGQIPFFKKHENVIFLVGAVVAVALIIKHSN